MPKTQNPTAPTVKTTVKRKKPIEEADVVPALRFYPTTDLHTRLLAVLDLIESASDATPHRTKLSELVNELTGAGLDYYFIQTFKDAKVGFVTQQSANIGMIGVKQVLAPVIRNILGRLGHTQLQSIAKSIRKLMI